ncbi:hypothetical protein BV898_10310 [Hypsibius exemplaris]|uniref:Uncharacterized protein n=1 Tax=Hypsibius exemplaris TaxID=2072580 RepID=A0A1W0WK44_HYPEX|nr:hypothetical protein BV898_10310 [Hypsibius exemplaris]
MSGRPVDPSRTSDHSTGAAGLAEEIVGQGFTASAARISGGLAEVHVQPSAAMTEEPVAIRSATARNRSRSPKQQGT